MKLFGIGWLNSIPACFDSPPVVIGLFIEFLFSYLFIYLVSKVKRVSKISNSL